MNGEPVMVGEVAEDVLGQLYHDQMIAEYVQASEQITLNALVMLCLAARRFDERVKYVLLDDSDQGEWQVCCGLAAGVPTYAGQYVDELDLDSDDMFDEDWSSSIDDRTEHVWLLFCETTDLLPEVRFLNVDRVLSEISLPWRTVGVGSRG